MLHTCSCGAVVWQNAEIRPTKRQSIDEGLCLQARIAVADHSIEKQPDAGELRLYEPPAYYDIPNRPFDNDLHAVCSSLSRRDAYGSVHMRKDTNEHLAQISNKKWVILVGSG